jgi:hypothetical protein
MALVKCLMLGTVIAYGTKTQQRYVFNDSNNHILEIDDTDLPEILNKKDIQGGCCNAPRVEKDIFILQ